MNIKHKMISIGKYIFSITIVLTVTACHQDFTLLDTNGDTVGKGKLEVNANSPTLAFFTIEGNTYSGSWSTEKVYEGDLAKRHRLISSRSYASYMQGNSEDQLKHGHAVLTSDVGKQIECDFYYRIHPKVLDCNFDGRMMNLIMSD
jgi:hypothetical protein